MKHIVRLRIIIFLFYLIQLPGCTFDQEGEGVIKIDISRKSSLKLDDYITRVEILPLETAENALINNIFKVVFFKDSFYIQNATTDLFVFNSNGHFLRSIGQNGRGPGEYSYISDFHIDKITGNIEILEPMGTVKVYSSDGEFLNSFKNPCQEVTWMLNLDKENLGFFHNFSDPGLEIFSRTQGKVVNSYFTFPFDYYRRRPYDWSRPHYLFGNDIFIHFPYSNNVYKYDNNVLKKVISFDFGNNSFETDRYNWEDRIPREGVLEVFKEKRYATGFHNHFETERFMYKHFYYGEDEKLLVFDKRKREYKIITTFEGAVKFHFSDRENYKRFMDETAQSATEAGTRIPWVLNNTDGADYVITCFTFNNRRLWINPNILDEANLERFKSIGPSDNPVLVKIWFK